jgi:hypothetical protein
MKVRPTQWDGLQSVRIPSDLNVILKRSLNRDSDSGGVKNPFKSGTLLLSTILQGILHCVTNCYRN